MSPIDAAESAQVGVLVVESTTTGLGELRTIVAEDGSDAMVIVGSIGVESSGPSITGSIGETTIIGGVGSSGPSMTGSIGETTAVTSEGVNRVWSLSTTGTNRRDRERDEVNIV